MTDAWLFAVAIVKVLWMTGLGLGVLLAVILEVLYGKEKVRSAKIVRFNFHVHQWYRVSRGGRLRRSTKKVPRVA